jgi:hypothetical protein
VGICYYFARPDNKTLFDMDKSYGLGEILCPSDYYLEGTEPVSLGDIETAIILWYGDRFEEVRGTGEEQALTSAILAFADGHPIYYINEHHHWFDEWFFDVGRRLERAGDRWDVVQAHRARVKT